MKVTGIAKSAVTIQHISRGWKDESPGETGTVELIRLKVAKESLTAFAKPVDTLLQFVEQLVLEGFLSLAVSSELFAAMYFFLAASPLVFIYVATLLRALRAQRSHRPTS